MLELRWEKCRDGSICCQVFALDGWLKTLRDTTGPTFYACGAIEVLGFAMLDNTKLSLHELPIAETSMQLDPATRVLKMNI
jgi:hypothetical protein